MFKKKYKLRKRKKLLNPYLIFAFLAIILLFMSYGYALLSDTLTISGIANVKKRPEPGTYGNSTYTYENQAYWGVSPANSITYKFDITITNLDMDYLEYVIITFETNPGCAPELYPSPECNVWQAESVTCSGNTVTVIFSPSNAYWLMGENAILYFQIPYTIEYDMNDIYVKNLTLNGLYATCLNQKENIEDEIPDPGNNTNTNTNTNTNNTNSNNNQNTNTTPNSNTENTNSNSNNNNNTSGNNNNPNISTDDLSYNYTSSTPDNGINIPYQLTLNLSGLDSLPSTISFDVPEGFHLDYVNFWSGTVIDVTGNTITIEPEPWLVYQLPIITLSGQLYYPDTITSEDFTINNVKIDGVTIPYSP